jgi:hypothetical protein
MNRRSYLTGMLAAAAGAGLKAQAQAAAKQQIVLYCDVSVDPKREEEMLKNFHTVFQPAAAKFQGFIDVKMVKFHDTIMGTAPAGVNYRFQLTYESRELRDKWAASDVHKKVWPTVENTFTSRSYTVLVFETK